MRNELENKITDESICKHHLVNQCVYVHNANERIGMVIGLLLEGYHILNSSVHQIYDMVSINPFICIDNGEIYACELMHNRHSKKYHPNLCGAIEHEQWLKELDESLKKHSSTEEEIQLFINDREKFNEQWLDKFEKKWEYRPENAIPRPTINCGTNVEMFETLTLLRDDDTIFDSKQRKKLGIYDWKRLFIHNHFKDEFSRFRNKEDYDPAIDHKNNLGEGYEDYYFRLATLQDVLEKFKIGELNIC